MIPGWPFCVGLTGGIGSGKSAVAERFAGLDVPVIDTDLIAHALTGPQGAAMPDIVQAFGPEFAHANGALDRAAMRARVFSDPDARKRLEAILHPRIRAEAVRHLAVCTAPYALLVVPLLAENLSAYRPMLDRILVVDCDESQQLQRTSKRPGLDLEQAKAILRSQASQVARLAIADDLIENRTDWASLDRQVERLHSLYLALAKNESDKICNNSLH